ncbi:MAG: arginine--tRNA ligase [Eubacteriales bacterium]|nr:arginine--tRNA ligase [Eubacteriales bacterium]
MEKLIESLNKICAGAFEAAGYDAAYGRVNLSNRPDLCEYQCNGAMALAKAAHKKPFDIAQEVLLKLKDHEAFAKAEVCMPGFINLDIAPSYLSSYLNRMEEGEELVQESCLISHSADGENGVQSYALPPMPALGLSFTEKPETIIVDYGGANVAKPLHVGHLRSAVIGEAIKRMGARMGHHMIGDVHLGDWGLQMGLIIEELKDRQQTDFTIADLEEIYPAASKKAKETDADGKLTPAAESFKARALHSTSLLQNGDPECRKIWEHIMELSLKDLKKNYDGLDVYFELWKGESDAQKYISEMIADLEKRGIAYTSQGALVVDVQEPGDTKELPPCIIRKSDGAALYATTDLATMVEREQFYGPDSYIYIADLRQNLHYTSFFRVARKSGIVRPEEKLTFLGFGTMNGKDGKPFKTREGGVMRLSVLISDITDKVYEKIRETRSEEEIPEAEAREIARMVGLAAIKYGDLSNQASKDYIFDIDRFTSFEGNTGPYILYTIVRIGSILNKYFETTSRETLSGALANAKADGKLRLSEAGGKSDKALSLLLARYNDVLAGAWEELAPHKICQYIYEVSNAFNSFYHDTKILAEPDEEKKRGYIALLAMTKAVLESSIEILGFSAPERM